MCAGAFFKAVRLVSSLAYLSMRSTFNRRSATKVKDGRSNAFCGIPKYGMRGIPDRPLPVSS